MIISRGAKISLSTSLILKILLVFSFQAITFYNSSKNKKSLKQWNFSWIFQDIINLNLKEIFFCILSKDVTNSLQKPSRNKVSSKIWNIWISKQNIVFLVNNITLKKKKSEMFLKYNGYRKNHKFFTHSNFPVKIMLHLAKN